MLGSIMEDWIRCYCDGTFVVTVQRNVSFNEDPNIPKKNTQLANLQYCVSYSMIFSFSAEPEDNYLFLTPSKNKRGIQKNTVS